MKIFQTETKQNHDNLFDKTNYEFNQISTQTFDPTLSETNSSMSEGFLDNFLTTIKFVFLYLPGTLAIHFTMLGLALALFYSDFPYGLLFGVFGFFIVGMFMIMIGLGKLSDLKYLRTVITILCFSAINAILYDILAVFIKGDFFGF